MGINTELRALLDMGEAALNAGRWEQALSLHERVLTLDPASARGYMGRLLSRMRVRTQEELIRLVPDFPEDEDLNMALLYADEAERDELMELCRRCYAAQERVAPSLDAILGRKASEEQASAPQPDVDPAAPAQPAAADEPQAEEPAAEEPPEASEPFDYPGSAIDAMYNELMQDGEARQQEEKAADPKPLFTFSDEPVVPPDVFPGIPAPSGTPVAYPAARTVSRTDIRMLESRIRTQTNAVNDVLGTIACERSFGLSTLPLCLVAAAIAYGALWYYGEALSYALSVTAAVFAAALVINLTVSSAVSRGRMRRMAEENFSPEMDKLEALYEELYSARTGRKLNYSSTLLELRRDVQKGRYGNLLPDYVLYADEMM